ncbi:DNA-directed RNA polymerase subunit K [Methanonatronarchaeum sp. AMET6-2]|uniref:DNA-directed RNA polymerase subunit K n=1 Tax=Methanonatronarchaeum sp. AMET6-2 TaxID=2933293 RepID=UPI0011FA0012|nr:DNA-directed RNA polymerase subunit K [Methanonatronarchaeum sp. AMET6-2]RZN61886.1 MAG: DNA-directed RNA polymerase subunit K [Methanonatronarchaeia archaeon]UOY10616.1 DNA-directed RNA polymerase subunit K [Methanonatronarchaeum sp. AMET6-2]
MKYTKFEKARIIGARALQISLGAPVLVEVDEDMESIDIARKELKEGVIPLTVRDKTKDRNHYFGNLEDYLESQAGSA